MQLDEIGERAVDVVKCERPVGMARELNLLPGGELGEELAGELGGLVLQAAQLRLEGAIASGQFAELAHPRYEVDDRLFEGENVRRGGHGEPRTLAHLPFIRPHAIRTTQRVVHADVMRTRRARPDHGARP